MEIIGDFWMQFTDIDKGFFTLLRSLVIQPGIVAREYIAGKRKKHFGPLNFYLIVGTLLILSMNVTEWIHANGTPSKATAGASTQSSPGDTGVTNPSTQSHSKGSQNIPADSIGSPSARMKKINTRRMAATSFWKQYSDLVSIAAAPLLCVFFWMFYRSAGFNYTELLVACFYMMGFTNLVFAVIVSPISSSLASMGSYKANYMVTGIFKLFEILYFTYFCFQLTTGLVRRPLLRASIVSTLVAVFWVVLTFALMSVYITTGFGLD
ncbi:DUF3667 domain-containing protein [Chryseolinea sp. T2]|uniref:DUF3667 domain-containing protein n=1 Tax=Chryseolinea sp. T2 TaxID=3129255 RepID=UPI0030771468